MYANEIYFGHGNYGVEAASRYYFGKSVKDVTLAEAALLAGIVQRPEDQSPFRRPALARARRSTALRRMEAAGMITAGQRRLAEAEPLPTAPALKETIVGPYFCEEIRQYLERTYGEKDLYRRGLRVDSTLDPELQAFADEAWAGVCGDWRGAGGSGAPAISSRRVMPTRAPTWIRAGKGRPSREGETLRAVVSQTGKAGATVRIAETSVPLPPAGFVWTGAKSSSKILRAGRPRHGDPREGEGGPHGGARAGSP